jgi:hypothetical protein
MEEAVEMTGLTQVLEGVLQDEKETLDFHSLPWLHYLKQQLAQSHQWIYLRGG